MSCDTVVFIIFNRPDTTRRVFEAIAAAKPSRLLIVADGPRADRPGERELCHEARAVVEQIGWPCDVRRNYSDVNLGCRDRVASGLDWVFDQTEEAVILEDDCVPSSTFFRFARELLDRYRNDNRVMAIGGSSFQPTPPADDASYYFSRYFHCWGWATWKRAWQRYDVDMNQWPSVYGMDWLLKVLEQDEGGAGYWAKQFDDARRGVLNTWDYQFVFAAWCAGAFTILPARNLVSNIGFGPDATHTVDGCSPHSQRPTWPMQFPLRHPAAVSRDIVCDEWSQTNVFGRVKPSSQGKRLGRMMFSRLKALLQKAG